MILVILKAFLVGVLASCPIGPVIILVAQKTIVHGRWTGFKTGLGSAVIDSTYVTGGLFAIAFLSEFIARYEGPIMVAGGIVIACVGLGMAVKKVSRETASSEKTGSFPLQAMGCALANPGALAYDLALIALLKIDVISVGLPVWAAALTAVCATVSWWFFFTWLMNRLGARITDKAISVTSRIAGIVLSSIGLFVLVKGVMTWI